MCSSNDDFFDGLEINIERILFLSRLSRHAVTGHEHFFPFHIRMDIDMHRGSHIGMPQQFAYCFHVKSMGNAVGCKDMTEHMKVKGGQAKCVQDFPESVLQGPRFGIFFFLSRKKVAIFVSFLFLQKTQKIVREGNLPVRIQGFWRCDCYFRS